jgi:hypothetical protein
MILLLAINLVTFGQNGQSVTINSEDVVSLVTPHRGFDPKLKCIINLIDGKHIAVAITCEEVRQRLQK